MVFTKGGRNGSTHSVAWEVVRTKQTTVQNMWPRLASDTCLFKKKKKKKKKSKKVIDNCGSKVSTNIGRPLKVGKILEVDEIVMFL